MEKRKKIVAGNWKMNTLINDAVLLVKEVVKSAPGDSGVTVVFFPPFPYIRMVRELLTEEMSFFAGAQNCSEHDKGAYTGEVSAAMLRDVGCRYVIVGHSERRQYFGEKDSQLAAKAAMVIGNHMTLMYCVGETLEQRKAGDHFAVVEKQVRALRETVAQENTGKLVLAYEPVWAIGTGETASPQQAQEMHAFIRSVVAGAWDKDTAEKISILYGGSCNPSNARELFACPDVDGGLIGGASLKAADFCSIIGSF